jgi:hypothetical protein
MKIALLFLALNFFNLALSQEKAEIKFIEKQSLESPKKKHSQSRLDIFLYDDLSKKRFEIILVRINGISLSLSDTSNHHLSLSPGMYNISFGWVGYEWSKTKKIKVRIGNDYRVEGELTSIKAWL